MVLTRGDENDAVIISRGWLRKCNPEIGGNPEVRTHLENLGFVVGGKVTIISTIGGNLIVNVKESRVAISREMAGKIMV